MANETKPRKKNRHVLVVGDMSGKGIPAALFMMMAKTMIKDKTLPGHKPGEIIREINEQLIESNRAQLFITIWFMVVGIMEDMEYEEKEWQLQPGDRLFIYSDGVTEAEDENQKQFGNDRLVEVLNGMKDRSQKEILEELGKELEEFSGEDNQFGDITMMGFTYFGAEEQ